MSLSLSLAFLASAASETAYQVPGNELFSSGPPRIHLTKARRTQLRSETQQQAAKWTQGSGPGRQSAQQASHCIRLSETEESKPF